jgi:hypothetical protein
MMMLSFWSISAVAQSQKSAVWPAGKKMALSLTFDDGRGWRDEAPNDLAYLNMVQLSRMEMDGKEFADMLPLIQDAAKRQALPVRFYYMQDEIRINAANATAAMDKLEVSNYSQADGKNSAWSKPWLMQGTNKPW